VLHPYLAKSSQPQERAEPVNILINHDQGRPEESIRTLYRRQVALVLKARVEVGLGWLDVM